MNYTNEQRAYLKYLFFNDAVSNDRHGMNHNAMDRSCMWDVFKKDIDSPDFAIKLASEKQQYDENRIHFRGISEYGVLFDDPEGFESYATEYAQKYLAVP